MYVYSAVCISSRPQNNFCLWGEWIWFYIIDMAAKRQFYYILYNNIYNIIYYGTKSRGNILATVRTQLNTTAAAITNVTWMVQSYNRLYDHIIEHSIHRKYAEYPTRVECLHYIHCLLLSSPRENWICLLLCFPFSAPNFYMYNIYRYII